VILRRHAFGEKIVQYFDAKLARVNSGKTSSEILDRPPDVAGASYADPKKSAESSSLRKTFADNLPDINYSKKANKYHERLYTVCKATARQCAGTVQTSRNDTRWKTDRFSDVSERQPFNSGPSSSYDDFGYFNISK